jgi:hypothetical protein
MAETFPFVKVPPSLARFFGQRDAETRVYRREGSQGEIAEWYDKIIEVAEDVVSPGGVCMFADVSRAAVYLAINEGRLTAFGFHVLSESRSIFGFKKRRRERPYVFIPVSECKAWGKIIEEKLKAKALTEQEEPGWVDDRTFRKLTAGMERGKYPKKREDKK